MASFESPQPKPNLDPSREKRESGELMRLISSPTDESSLPRVGVFTSRSQYIKGWEPTVEIKADNEAQIDDFFEKIGVLEVIMSSLPEVIRQIRNQGQ